MIKKRTVTRMIILVVIFIAIIAFGLTIANRNVLQKKNAIITTGMTKGQQGYFQERLSKAFQLERYVDDGKKFMERGQYEEAIESFQKAYDGGTMAGDRGVAIYHMANVYEKKRDYKKALEYVVIDRDEYVSDWAKGPVVERAKYLEYALEGNYEMSVKHAEMALEEDKKLPNRPKGGSSSYIERLNDIKASKEYIESLK